MSEINNKIQEIKRLQCKINEYKELYPEITYRINIINGTTKKPVRKESLMHHIFKLFRKETKYNFSQDEYFSCLVLDDDIDIIFSFLKQLSS